jgi:hypothetical protein
VSERPLWVISGHLHCKDALNALRSSAPPIPPKLATETQGAAVRGGPHFFATPSKPARRPSEGLKALEDSEPGTPMAEAAKQSLLSPRQFLDLIR